MSFRYRYFTPRTDVDAWEDQIEWDDGAPEYEIPTVRAPRYRHFRDYGADLEYEKELYDILTGQDPSTTGIMDARQNVENINAEFYGYDPQLINPGYMTPQGQVPVNIPAAQEARDEVVEQWIEEQNTPDVIEQTISSLDNPSMWGPNAQGTFFPEEELEDESTGTGWNPNGLTNLLQDQIAFINELTAAGILNVEDARAATEQRLDEVWGDLQAGFQSELDDLVAGDAAAAASLGATTDSIAADLADMGVDAAVLDPERRAMEEMMAMQASNEMNFAEGLRDSAAFGQADRRSSMNFGMDDLILGLEMGQLQQTGQLENMAEMAQMQGSAMGVDPALIFADMLSGTSVAQQMAAGNASAAADANMMGMAEYLAAAVPDFGGDPMLAYMTLNGMLPGNYFKPEQQGFLDSLQPGVIGALQAEIQAIMQNNQNISFQDATRIAVDSLYNLGE